MKRMKTFRVEFNSAMRLVLQAKKLLGDGRVRAFLHLQGLNGEGVVPQEVIIKDDDHVAVGVRTRWCIKPGAGSSRVRLDISLYPGGIRIDMYQINIHGTVLDRTSLHTDSYYVELMRSYDNAIRESIGEHL